MSELRAQPISARFSMKLKYLVFLGADVTLFSICVFLYDTLLQSELSMLSISAGAGAFALSYVAYHSGYEFSKQVKNSCFSKWAIWLVTLTALSLIAWFISELCLGDEMTTVSTQMHIYFSIVPLVLYNAKLG